MPSPNFSIVRFFRMDTFTVNGKLSLNVSGIGFDGHVTNLFGIKSTRGLIGYVMLTVQEFLKFREFETTISMGEQNIHTQGLYHCHCKFFAIRKQCKNCSRCFCDAMVCCTVNIVRKGPCFRLDFVYFFFTGQLGKSKFCEILETQSLRLKTKKPIYYHVDGEPCGVNDTFDIELIPAALHILVPTSATLKRAL